MKKFLLSTLLSVFVLSMTYAQFNISTNTTIGQTLSNKIYNDKDTFVVDFNSTAAVNSTYYVKITKGNNIGKDSLLVKKCQTQKGLQVKGFLDATTTSEYKIGSADCNNYGSNRNPLCIYSLDSLKKVLAVSPAAIGGNVSDSLTKAAACLFRMGDNNAAFGLYPGKIKRIEYGYYINLVGKQIDKISFDINTLDPGNSGKTATYSLKVYKSSTFTPANMLGDSVNNFYVTGSGLVTVNLATAINVNPSVLSNKTIYILIKTLGTTNSSGVTDAVPNPVDANNVPLITDPTIIFDNMSFSYQIALWKVPTLAIGASLVNTYLDHNNGSIITGTSSDFAAGTPVSVPAATNTAIKFYLTSVGRVQNLNIKEGNNSSAHQAAFAFAATGAVKAKDTAGNYTVDVPYLLNINGTTAVYDLDIAAPVSGLPVNDTLEVTTNATIPVSATRTVRFEITNGTRFWYDISAIGDLGTGLKHETIPAVKSWTSANKLFIVNATENVVIYNVAGQKLKVTSAIDAAKGINLGSGIYILKTGSTVQKVLVQ